MPGFVNPRSLYRLRLSSAPECEEIFRAIDKSVEGYYEFHIYATNGVSKLDRTVMTQRCVELILSVGGEIREDWRAQTGLVFYTLPPGAPNPVQEDDAMFRGKMVTRYWPPYSKKEREIFGLDKI